MALGDNGKMLLKEKFTQKQLIAFTANLQTCLIGMEACAGTHFLGRALRSPGHDVKLIPAQFVKPFVRSNKNDFIDAEAIAKAVDRHNMRFVPIKADDQLDLQALHRVQRPPRKKVGLNWTAKSASKWLNWKVGSVTGARTRTLRLERAAC